MLHVAMVPQRIARWLLFTGILVLVMYLIAGRTDLPMVNAYVATTSVIFLVATLFVDPELMKERTRRGQAGEDPVRLALLRVLYPAFLVTALLDVGRFHWSDTVPRALQVGALIVSALALVWTLWAVAANRFFLPVIRIQAERGHRVVAGGPYARVRHPGYLGNVIAVPASALALGSWVALVPALAISLLFVARTAHEDHFLHERLDGYREYATRVRYRLVPHVW